MVNICNLLQFHTSAARHNKHSRLSVWCGLGMCYIECSLFIVSPELLTPIFPQYVIIAASLLQVVQLLQSFSLYTEQLDRSMLVKPDVENRMWLLTADRTPYTEGVVLFPFVGQHFHATTFTFLGILHVWMMMWMPR